MDSSSNDTTMRDYGPNNLSTLKYLQYKTNNSNSLSNALSSNLNDTSTANQQQQQQPSTHKTISNNASFESQSSSTSLSSPLAASTHPNARIIVNPSSLANTTNANIMMPSSASSSTTPSKTPTPVATTVLVNSQSPTHQTVLDANTFNTDVVNTGNFVSNYFPPSTKPSTASAHTSSSIMMKPLGANQLANQTSTSSTSSVMTTSLGPAGHHSLTTSTGTNTGLSGSSTSVNKKQPHPNDKFINIGLESLKINTGVPFKQLRNPILVSNSKETSNKEEVSTTN